MTSSENTYRDPNMTVSEKNGILHCRFSDNLDMNVEIAKQCVSKRLSFAHYTSYPVLVDMRGLHSITKEAREYLAKEGTQLITAGALLVNSPLSRILGNLFLRLNKPNVPTMIFTSPERAEEWLGTFVKRVQPSPK